MSHTNNSISSTTKWVPKFITIINHIDSLNLGDFSLLYMTISLLNKAFCPAQIYVLSFNLRNDDVLIDVLNDSKVKFLQSPGRTSQNHKMKIRFEMLLFLIRLIVGKFNKSDHSVNHNPVSDALQKSDLVVVRGGDNLADIYGVGSLIAQLYNILLALILRKKIIILGTSIGPFKKKLLQKVVLYFLRKTQLITTRDRKSFEILRQEGFEGKKVHLIPDIAFDLPIERDSKYDFIFNESDKVYIGIGISALVLKYREKGDFVNYMTGFCESIIKKYNSKIILIPHVLSQFNDEEFGTQIMSRLNNKNDAIMIHESNPMKIKYIISKLDLLISFRMHPLVHALSTKVPAIGIDYNDKTIELFKLFQKEEWVIPLDQMERLSELVDKFLLSKVNSQGDQSGNNAKTVSANYIRLLQEFADKKGNMD